MNVPLGSLDASLADALFDVVEQDPRSLRSLVRLFGLSIPEERLPAFVAHLMTLSGAGGLARTAEGWTLLPAPVPDVSVSEAIRDLLASVTPPPETPLRE